jgi:hypothetical protein
MSSTWSVHILWHCAKNTFQTCPQNVIQGCQLVDASTRVLSKIATRIIHKEGRDTVNNIWNYMPNDALNGIKITQ